MTEPYNRLAQPPAPILSIRLRALSSDQSTDPLPALIDTGADATLIPIDTLLAIGAEETSPGWLRSFSGERVPVALYFVDVLIGELVLPGIRVAGSARLTEVLLGRDVLNKLVLVLDGPQAETSLLSQAEIARHRARR